MGPFELRLAPRAQARMSRPDHAGMMDHMFEDQMEAAGQDTWAWLVINTHPHRENLAMENLIRQNFETYCPQMRKVLRARTGTREVLRPLFPNYVFVRVNVIDRAVWRPILSTYGVRRVVRFGEQTPTLDAGFITALQAREIGGAIVKPTSPYQVGQTVRISGGAFDGIIARIIEIGPNDRLMILMDLLGQSVRGRAHANQVTQLIAD